MSRDLTILIPSRGRPSRLEHAVRTARKTSPEVKVMVYLDEDDPSRPQYSGCGYQVTVGPRIGAARSSKALQAACSTEFMMVGSDDIEFLTPGWAGRLTSLIPLDGVGISHGNDGWKGASGIFVFHRRVYELTGLWPDVFWHFGPDGYVGHLMMKLQRVFSDMRVKIPHLHFRIGKAEEDQTYRDRALNGGGRDDLRNALEKYADRDLEILRAAMR